MVQVLDPLQAAKSMVGAFPWTPDILSMAREAAAQHTAASVLPADEYAACAAGSLQLQLPLHLDSVFPLEL